MAQGIPRTHDQPVPPIGWMSAADFADCVYGPHERRGFAIARTGSDGRTVPVGAEVVE